MQMTSSGGSWLIRPDVPLDACWHPIAVARETSAMRAPTAVRILAHALERLAQIHVIGIPTHCFGTADDIDTAPVDLRIQPDRAALLCNRVRQS